MNIVNKQYTKMRIRNEHHNPQEEGELIEI